MNSLHIIYASTSGHTEYVVNRVVEYIHTHAPTLQIAKQKAEVAEPTDLLEGDILILGSGTWNTGGMEGQLNTHMHVLLEEKGINVDLKNKPITFISLGDDRYYFRTRCTEHFLRFQREHNGNLFMPPLVLVNEPYEQEQKIDHWAAALLTKMRSNSKKQGINE